MATFGKDTYLWLKDEEEGYIPAKAKATFTAGERGTVENLMTETSYTLSAAESKACLPMDEQSLSPIPDMVMLKQLDEPALLHNLRLRYEKDEIYTSIGSILVSVNPFKKLNIYSPEIVDDYIANGGKAMPPHIFGTADAAYRSLVDSKLSQSCIVSGESGAGKTEATKLFLQYLAEKSSAGDDKAKTGASMLHQKILEANPLMEAFGNAKTLRNNNSSRFGKLIEVSFDNKRGKIVGGNIVSYLLEKSRIVGQGEGERNFHIFYQMCTYASSDPSFNKELKLLDASQYHYTNPNEIEDDIVVEGMFDANEMENTLKAMDVLDFGDKVRMDILKTVVAVLTLGNVEFSPVDERCVIMPRSSSSLKRAAQLLGVDSDALGEALLKTRVRETFRDHNVEQATAARDALAKATYGYLFDWLIEKINKSLLTQGKMSKKNISKISVLDIFGFESFAINSFEQLCINYCNEKLQAHFNEHIFSLEQELYAKEGIVLSRIDFTDNQPTLDKIEGKRDGVLAILDEVDRMPKGDDKVFLDKVLDQVDDVLLKKPDVKALRDPKNRLVFTIAHYAGDVSYTVTGFLVKNKDKLLDGLAELGASSQNKFIKSLFSSTTLGRASKKTLGNQFKGQLQDLMDTLTATEPHYVRTIKPNDNKVADEYVAPMILDQMRYAGLMEVCRIRKLGYPVRKTFEEFYRRYKPLASELAKIKTHGALCKDLEANGILITGEYQIGNTKVFMRDNQFNSLEAARADILGAVVCLMQKVVRGFIARKRYAKYKKVISALANATESRNPERIEDALRGIGILPFMGKYLEVVQHAKKVLAQVGEEHRVITLVKNAIASRQINSLNSAIEAAEKLKLSDLKVVKEAISLREKVLKEKKILDSLKKAIEANEESSLESAISQADGLKLSQTGEYKDAVVALQYLKNVREALEELDKAIGAKNLELIVKYSSRMAELGKADHPSVKQGQEITKEINILSEEAERNRKKILRNLEAAIEREDLASLKKLRPQALKVGITGELVERANALVEELEKKAEAFSELSAAKSTLLIKYEGFDGVAEEDVTSFEKLLAAAKAAGFSADDEEIIAMNEFKEKLVSQIEAQKYLATVVKSKDEAELRKALAMIQDLGLRTGLAKEIEQEVKILDTAQLEEQQGERAKAKEELKKQLVEATEESRADEKADLLEERTQAHKDLIAKASDSNYKFTKYYKIREDGDYVEHLPEDAQAIFAEKKLEYQSKNIPKSLSQFPNEISKIAVQVYKAILQYCGDLANPFPNTMAKFMLTTCLENPVIVDEVYLQLMKHLTKNRKPVSEDRGWGLMCMITATVPPTTDFAPFVVNFLLKNKSVSGLIGNYARLCIVHLDGRIRLGPSNLLPTNEIVDTYSQRPPILAIINRVAEGDEPMEIPVWPDEDVDKVLLDTVFPILETPEESQFLYGLYVIDGRPDTDLDLLTRLTRFYQKYNPAKLAHIDYFVNAWGENQEGLFHKLETKYGPEPTEEEVAQALRKKGKNPGMNFLQLPITAAIKAAKRLGLTTGPSKPPPSPQTAWPIPWWTYLGDVYLRMVKQNRVPVFTLKRKLYINGELMSTELTEQAKFDVVKGNLAVSSQEDIVTLAAIHLTLKCGGEVDPKRDFTNAKLTEVLPVIWLANHQPKEIWGDLKNDLKKLKGASTDVLNEKYMQICRKQIGYHMTCFYVSTPNSNEITVVGVDTAGVHMLDPTRTQERKMYGYRSIKEYGASPSVFWMKVIEKTDKTKKGTERLINLSTLQAWDLYGLVYDYTFNAEKLNLK